MHHTMRKGNGVPIDQALEKAYNKPAKGRRGVIGFSRRKESVTKWNLLKHEKSKYTQFIDVLCDYTNQDEYSLQREFSVTSTAAEEKSIQTHM